MSAAPTAPPLNILDQPMVRTTARDLDVGELDEISMLEEMSGGIDAEMTQAEVLLARAQSGETAEELAKPPEAVDVNLAANKQGAVIIQIGKGDGRMVVKVKDPIDEETGNSGWAAGNMVNVYDRLGRPVPIRLDMVLKTLRKRENGRPVYTARPMVKFVEPHIPCLVCRGFGRKKAFYTDQMLEDHMRNRHERTWRAAQSLKERSEKEETRDLMRIQTAALEQIASGRITTREEIERQVREESEERHRRELAIAANGIPRSENGRELTLPQLRSALANHTMFEGNPAALIQLNKLEAIAEYWKLPWPDPGATLVNPDGSQDEPFEDGDE